MPRPLGKLRVLVSSSVLFDMENEHLIWEQDPQAYMEHMFKNKDVTLKKGACFHFVERLLSINEATENKDLIEISLFSKHDEYTGQRIEQSIKDHGLEFHMRSYVKGRPLSPNDLRAYGCDLLLTTDETDAQTAIDNGVAAAIIHAPNGDYENDNPTLNLWFDGDAVAFGDSAERVYKDKGLEGYRKHEFNNASNVVEAGPFTAFLQKLSTLKKDAQSADFNFPVKMMLITARGGAAAHRAMNTIHAHGIEFDEMHYLGGASKRDFLKEHEADIFFDDQIAHTGPASEVLACGIVPYRTGSPMSEHLAAEAKKKRALEKRRATIAKKKAASATNN